MLLTATEFKQSLGHYLDLANDEDVYVLRQGKPPVRVSTPARDGLAILDSLVGVAAGSQLNAEEARSERLTNL
jgi:uncharacterized lipoprotein NlpE involved in copper resistance